MLVKEKEKSGGKYTGLFDPECAKCARFASSSALPRPPFWPLGKITLLLILQDSFEEVIFGEVFLGVARKT